MRCVEFLRLRISNKKWNDIMLKIIMQAELEAMTSVRINKSMEKISLSGK